MVGESLGSSEVVDSLPFRPQAPAGSVLERAIKECGHSRNQFVLTNLANCQPVNDQLTNPRWFYSAIDNCKQYMDKLVEQYRPKCILALGAVPMQVLTGMTGKQSDNQTITHLRGYVLKGTRYPEIPVVSSFHPSFLRRGNMHLLPHLKRDLELAVAVAQSGKSAEEWWAQDKVDYNVNPTEFDLDDLYNKLVRNPSLRLDYDIETHDSRDGVEDELTGRPSTVLQIQFSIAPGTGMAVPFAGVWVEWARRLMTLGNPKSGFNCFHKHTSILMANGKWKPIRSIQIGESVATVERGKVVSKPVTNRFLIHDDRPWVEVKVDGAYNYGVGRWGTRGVICTPDHEWIQANGVPKAAGELIYGDKVLLPRTGDPDLIHGTLLGDGYLSGNDGRLHVSHVNEGWAQAKADAFSVPLYKASLKGKNGWHASPFIYALSSVVGKTWRNLIYNDKQKQWSPPASLKSVAVFFGDDGCITRKKGIITAARFALHKFTDQDCHIALEYFRDMFGDASLYRHGGGYLLGLWRSASTKFFELIAPWLHPSMEYKLPDEYRGQYNGWMGEKVPQVGIVQEIVPFTSQRKSNRSKFCIEVADTHTFFTRAGLVKNCSQFDNPVLRAGGTDAQGDRFEPFVINGRNDDVRDMWLRMQPDSPANLQYVASFFGGPKHNIMPPWKHTSGQDLARYGIRDVDVLGRIMARLPGQLRDRGCWDSYDKWTRPLRPVLDDCQARGVPFDTAALDLLHIEVEAEKDKVFETLQQLVPEEVKGRHPKVGYKIVPREIKEGLASMGISASPTEILGTREQPIVEEYVQGLMRQPFVIREVNAPPSSLTKQEAELLTNGSDKLARWHIVEPFLPTGKDQVIRYMKYRKHPVPKVYGEEKETTKEMEMLRLFAKTGDPVYRQTLDYRGLLKIDSTYVNPFMEKLAEDGAVHTTFTCNPATGQLSTKSPSVQQFPIRKEIADSFRRCISARPGHVMLRYDYKSFHARTLGFEAQDQMYMKLAAMDIHSFVAAHMKKLPDADSLYSMPDGDLIARLNEIKKLYPEDRSRAKTCIAEGELVLTDKGLVPIENITLAHRVWDGVEWVQHDGVIFQGVKEVITYDGLTATPDHKVCTKDGLQVSFGQAASSLVRLETTGSGGQRIRTGHNHFRKGEANQRLSTSLLSMSDVWPQEVDQHGESVGGSDWGLPELWSDEVSRHRDFVSVGQKVRCNPESLHKVFQSSLDGLRRQRHQMPVRVESSVRVLGEREFASPNLSGGGDRPQGQQWPLQTGESETSDSQGAIEKQTKYSDDFVSGSTEPSSGLAHPLHSILDASARQERTDRRTDNRIGEDGCSPRGEEQRHHPSQTRTVRVYDIVNAGPRHRFTVSGKLVFNCILGIGFGLGYRKLFNQNREYFEGEKDAKYVLDLIQALFPKVFSWQKRRRASLINGQPSFKGPYILTRWNFIRWFYDVGRWDFRRDKLEPGDDYNECVAFEPANDAFGMMRWNMLELERLGWLERARLCNTVHDDLWLETPLDVIDEAIPAIWKVLERPCPHLVDPKVAPEGFACEVECQSGSNLGKYLSVADASKKGLLPNEGGMREVERPKS